MDKTFRDALISWNEKIADKQGYRVCKWESRDGAIHYDPSANGKDYSIQASIRINNDSCEDSFSLKYVGSKDEYIEMSFSKQGELKSCYFQPGEEGFPGTVANVLSILHMLNFLKEESDG